MNKYMLAVGLMIFTVSAVVLAHGGATGIVKERMDLMDELKSAMKSLKPMMRGQTPYDIEDVKHNARIIRDNAGSHMTKLFPEGTLHKPSEAKPEIWDEWENFQKISMNLERLGQALIDGAANEGSKRGMKGKGPHEMMGNGEPKQGQHMQGGHMMNQKHMAGSEHMMGQGHMKNSNQMMGQGMRQGLDQMSDEHLAKMPSQKLFRMIGQSCSACHKKYRVEK